jgi:hypothetical protein
MVLGSPSERGGCHVLGVRGETPRPRAKMCHALGVKTSLRRGRACSVTTWARTGRSREDDASLTRPVSAPEQSTRIGGVRGTQSVFIPFDYSVQCGRLYWPRPMH